MLVCFSFPHATIALTLQVQSDLPPYFPVVHKYKTKKEQRMQRVKVLPRPNFPRQHYSGVYDSTVTRHLCRFPGSGENAFSPAAYVRQKTSILNEQAQYWAISPL